MEVNLLKLVKILMGHDQGAERGTKEKGEKKKKVGVRFEVSRLRFQIKENREISANVDIR